MTIVGSLVWLPALSLIIVTLRRFHQRDLSRSRLSALTGLVSGWVGWVGWVVLLPWLAKSPLLFWGAISVLLTVSILMVARFNGNRVLTAMIAGFSFLYAWAFAMGSAFRMG